MKFQQKYPYILHCHFDSPLWGFVEDPENAKIVDELMKRWIEPTIPSYANEDKNPGNMLAEFIRAFQYGLAGEIDKEKGGVMVSGLYLVISRIIDVLMLKMQQCGVDIMVVVRIMVGLMIHEYYTTGEYGEKLWDLMDEEFEKREKGELQERGLLYFWTELVPFHTESASPRRDYAEMIMAEFRKDIIKDKEVELSRELLEAAYLTSINQPELLKFNKEGINLVKRKYGDRPDIIKGFQQQRIKRLGDYNVTAILTAIVAAIYHDEELFLCFDPYYFDMYICDRKHLAIKADHINLVMSFTNILNSVFCPHCLKNGVFGKFDIDFSKLSPTEATDIMKQMFDEAYEQVATICPDDITLTVEGKVDDNNKYDEVEKALPYGQVGFDKYADEKKGVAFKVQKKLKDYKKKVE